jgi:hypothetical protein
VQQDTRQLELSNSSYQDKDAICIIFIEKHLWHAKHGDWDPLMFCYVCYTPRHNDLIGYVALEKLELMEITCCQFAISRSYGN